MTTTEKSLPTIDDVQSALYLPCSPNAPNSILELRLDLRNGKTVLLFAEDASDFWNAWTKRLLGR